MIFHFIRYHISIPAFSKPFQIVTHKRYQLSFIANRSTRCFPDLPNMLYSRTNYCFATDRKRESDKITELKLNQSFSFISRILSYSAFLSQNQNTANPPVSKRVEEINKYFLQAGTTTLQVSQGLAQISNRFTLMLKLIGEKIQQQEGENKQIHTRKYEQLCGILATLNHHFSDHKFSDKVSPIEATLSYLSLETQLSVVLDMIEGFIQEEPSSIFSSDITNHDTFSNLFPHAWAKVKLIQLDPSTKAKHDAIYSVLRKLMIITTSAVVTQHGATVWNNQYWRKILFGFSVPFSLLNLQKAELKCYRLWRKPKLDKIKNLLDLPEKGYLQHLKKIVFPKINSNHFLYTSDNPSHNHLLDELEASKNHLKINIFEQKEGSKRILLLSHENLIYKSSKPQQKYSFFRKLVEPQCKRLEGKEVQNIIIHIHGGGFISMSSEMMQNYTRIWANELKIPVFSLDYRKPPYHRFPEPLQDCVSAYKFIVEKIGEHINIKPKNIILAGDSAGGNMVCALHAQLMKQNYPMLPKALFLIYPAIDLRMRYSKSRMNSLSDGIFLPSLLMLCQNEYLGKDKNNQFSPLASPILLSQKFTSNQKAGNNDGEMWPRNWPRTVIMCGHKDPLFDDSIRLLQRLSKSKVECKMLLYKDFSHGFMSLEGILPGGKKAVSNSVDELRQIIESF